MEIRGGLDGYCYRLLGPKLGVLMMRSLRMVEICGWPKILVDEDILTDEEEDCWTAHKILMNLNRK